MKSTDTPASGSSDAPGPALAGSPSPTAHASASVSPATENIRFGRIVLAIASIIFLLVLVCGAFNLLYLRSLDLKVDVIRYLSGSEARDRSIERLERLVREQSKALVDEVAKDRPALESVKKTAEESLSLQKGHIDVARAVSERLEALGPLEESVKRVEEEIKGTRTATERSSSEMLAELSGLKSKLTKIEQTVKEMPPEQEAARAAPAPFVPNTYQTISGPSTALTGSRAGEAPAPTRWIACRFDSGRVTDKYKAQDLRNGKITVEAPPGTKVLNHFYKGRNRTLSLPFPKSYDDADEVSFVSEGGTIIVWRRVD